MAVRSRLTLEQFLQMEETKPYSEFVRGDAIQKPFGSFATSSIQVYMSVTLFRFLNPGSIGEAFLELHCIFGTPGQERAYVPNLVYVSRERLTTGPYLRSAPDLAIEIRSPDQPMARFLDKIQFYLLHGVRLVWVIDPEWQNIAVLKPGEEVQVLTPPDTLEGDDVLPGFSVPVAEIFAQASNEETPLTPLPSGARE